jgi:hypothetical protein
VDKKKPPGNRFGRLLPSKKECQFAVSTFIKIRRNPEEAQESSGSSRIEEAVHC